MTTTRLHLQLGFLHGGAAPDEVDPPSVTLSATDKPSGLRLFECRLTGRQLRDLLAGSLHEVDATILDQPFRYRLGRELVTVTLDVPPEVARWERDRAAAHKWARTHPPDPPGTDAEGDVWLWHTVDVTLHNDGWRARWRAWPAQERLTP